jgi:hypothetical protein
VAGLVIVYYSITEGLHTWQDEDQSLRRAAAISTRLQRY